MKYLEDAAEELREAVAWYASRDVEVARRFHAAVRAAEALVDEEPRAYPVFDDVDGNAVRRVLIADFPYALLYLNATDGDWVVAVMHLRRQPGYWRVRMR